jgi:hypothetical protein
LDASDTPGTRASVDMSELKLERELSPPGSAWLRR